MFRTFQASECRRWNVHGHKAGCYKRMSFESILSTVNNRTGCIEREGIEKIKGQVSTFNRKCASDCPPRQKKHIWINISKALNGSLFYLKSNATATVNYEKVPNTAVSQPRAGEIPAAVIPADNFNTAMSSLQELKNKFDPLYSKDPNAANIAVDNLLTNEPAPLLIIAYKKMDKFDLAKWRAGLLASIKDFYEQLSIYIIILKIYIESQNISEFVEKYKRITSN